MSQSFSDMWARLGNTERKWFAWLSLGSVFISLADISLLAILVFILHYFQSPSALPAHIASIVEKGPVFSAGVLLLLFITKNAGALWLQRKQDSFSAKVATRVSRERMAAYLNGSFEEYVRSDAASLIRKVNLEPFEFAQQVLGGWQQIITQGALVLITIAAILVFDLRLFLLLFLFLFPPALLAFYVIRKKTSMARQAIRQTNEISYQYLLEASQGYMEAGIFQKKDFFIERFMKKRTAFSRELFRSLSLQQFPSRLMEIFAMAGLFLLLMISYQLGQSHDLLLIIAAFFAAAYKIIPGLVKLINLAGQVRSFHGEMAATRRELTVSLEPNTESLVPIKSLSLEKVRLAQGDKWLINGLDLTLASGEIMGIGGDSGIGKTSLLNLILGNSRAQSGAIRINGAVMDPAEIRIYWPRISYVRQENFLLQDSIARNITLEENCLHPERLDALMKQLGISWSQGTSISELQIGESGKNISGGQKQRIALARALYKPADLIILDEPFNELDTDSTLQIMNLLRSEAKRGAMIMLVTHEKQVMALCDKTIFLHAV